METNTSPQPNQPMENTTPNTGGNVFNVQQQPTPSPAVPPQNAPMAQPPASVSQAPATAPAAVRQTAPQAPTAPQSTPPPAANTPPIILPAAAPNNVPKFLSGKMLVTVASVGIIVALIIAGYLFFPSAFYNSVGKYLGLPKPSSLEEKADESAQPAEVQNEEETAPAEDNTQQAEEQPVAPENEAASQPAESQENVETSQPDENAAAAGSEIQTQTDNAIAPETTPENPVLEQSVTAPAATEQPRIKVPRKKQE